MRNRTHRSCGGPRTASCARIAAVHSLGFVVRTHWTRKTAHFDGLRATRDSVRPCRTGGAVCRASSRIAPCAAWARQTITFPHRAHAIKKCTLRALPALLSAFHIAVRPFCARGTTRRATNRIRPCAFRACQTLVFPHRAWALAKRTLWTWHAFITFHEQPCNAPATVH